MPSIPLPSRDSLLRLYRDVNAFDSSSGKRGDHVNRSPVNRANMKSFRLPRHGCSEWSARLQ